MTSKTTIWPFERKPKPVQTKALEKSAGQDAFAFFMEMQLGKTSVALAELEYWFMESDIDAAVVCCPIRLMGNWVAEAEKTGSTVKMVRWRGLDTKAKQKGFEKLIKDPEPFVLLTYYEAFNGRGLAAVEDLMSRRRAAFILDESSHIKNQKGQRSRDLRHLSKKYAIKKRELSGLPDPQGPHDLWAQFDFLGKVTGFNYYAWRHTFCEMGGYMGKKVLGSKNLDKLSRFMGPFTFWAEEKDWKQIPETQCITNEVWMTKEQEKAYRQMERDFLVKLDPEVDESVVVDMAITMRMKLQQISGGFVIDEEGETHELVSLSKNPKVRTFMEILGDTPGKVIVFVHFKKSMANLIDAILESGIEFSVITGGQSNEDTESEKARFNQDGGSRVILCNLQEGKWGHALVGGPNDPCQTLAFYENTFSLEDRKQGEARPRSTADDTYHFLVHDFQVSPEEEKVLKSLQHKEGLKQALRDSIREASSWAGEGSRRD